MVEPRERAIDELLVTRCQQGDSASFDLLVRRWQRRLWRYAHRLTGSDDAAWDVMQETWIAALRRIRKLRDPAWFTVWIYRIVRNKCADHLRRTDRQRRLTGAVAERQKESAQSHQAPSDAVSEALRRLAPDKQELLMLKYGSDLHVVEIAVLLGIPAGTVKSRLHHARDELRRFLEGDES